MEPDTTTPRISLLLSRLKTLNLEVSKNINSLVKRLDHLEHETIVLDKALHNIVDRTADTIRHLKSYTVTVKEPVDFDLEIEVLE
jgi:hypothetical protein